MGWPTEKLLQLIDLYKMSPCLWDPQDRYYKKSVIKDRAWQSISTKLGYNPVATKKKMDSILACYRRERKKHELDDYHVSKWFGYEPLSFLAYRSQVKKPQSEHHDPLSNIIQRDKSPSQLLQQQPSYDHSFEPKQSKVHIEETEVVSDTEKESSRCRRNNKNSLESNRRDVSDVFGEYVATKHRKYSDHVKNVIEHQIAQILFDADMGTYNPGTTTTITISGRAPPIDTEAEGSEDFMNAN
ncbi:uncharacterized protein LOC118740034 [Rhagoletis pomonella]|uniref:uncharacterized protein LOC118740034 n=1 Tax=Rhagoletis pomonella TaxID=28610 RepID=UPI001780A452|nr:uncharacterized protein LOC118740034 [Rhagoletis pomonella]